MSERNQPDSDSDGPRVNEDIMRIVFSHLRPPCLPSLASIPDSNSDSAFHQRIRRGTLFNAALVCKSFCYPALSVLWSGLTELDPLLRLLSSSFVSRTIDDVSSVPVPLAISLAVPLIMSLIKCKVALLLEPIDVGQWERSRFYAKFVRILECERCDIDASVYERLQERLNDQSLLPNLQELWWKEEGDIHEELALFISPALSIFHLSCPVDGRSRDPRERSIEEEELVMRTLLHRAQNLQEFQVDFSVSVVWPSVVSGITQFPNLRTVRFCHRLPSYLSYLKSHLPRSIFSLPNLQCLDTDIFLPVTDHSSPLVDCPTLDSFICRGDSNDVNHTIQSFDSPNLRHISYVCHESLGTISTFIQIASGRFARSLRDFRLKNTCPPWFLTVSLQEVLDPLRQLSRLTTIHLDLRGQSYSLTEENVKAFAIAWPCLEEFWVCNRTSVGQMGDGGLNLTSLQIFAAHCPNLRNLHLPINASTIQVSPLVRPPKSSEALQLLALVIPPPLSPWPEQEVLSAARYVAKVFPSLDMDRCLPYNECGCDLFNGVGKSVVREAGVITSRQQGEPAERWGI